MGIYNFSSKLNFLSYKWGLIHVLFKMEILLGNLLRHFGLKAYLK